MAQEFSCQLGKRAAITATPPYYSAENLRSDTFDVFKYFINLEIGTAANKFIKGNTIIKFAPKQNNKTFIRFDLLKLLIDSVKEGSTVLTYGYNDTILKVNFLLQKISMILPISLCSTMEFHRAIQAAGAVFILIILMALITPII
ncbi:MAG: hypothetical protein IPJ60_03810 [Sphingobacteriaceae bacterium]|nr:hypothetical protein [Sphingobacteriaceae bacterium]